MNQQFLRRGIRTSEAWNKASWFEQSLYIRLITLADASGRYDGRIQIIHSDCFALRDDVKQQETAAAASRLQELGLVRFHKIGDKEYLQITKWRKTAEPNSGYHPQARTVLRFLNESCGRRFREVDANLKIISQRLQEPEVELGRVKQMITRQCMRWKGTDMEDYLRPETLFRKSKFDGYYSAKDMPVNGSKKNVDTNQIQEDVTVKLL